MKLFEVLNNPVKWQWSTDTRHPFKHDITGEGNTFKVFTIVLEIIQAFITKHKPDTFFFSASEPSIVKLYRRFVSQFKRQGWKVKEGTNSEDETTWGVTR